MRAAPTRGSSPIAQSLPRLRVGPTPDRRASALAPLAHLAPRLFAPLWACASPPPLPRPTALSPDLTPRVPAFALARPRLTPRRTRRATTVTIPRATT